MLASAEGQVSYGLNRTEEEATLRVRGELSASAVRWKAGTSAKGVRMVESKEPAQVLGLSR